MARFLTPSKIALLALISIYTEGVVPNSAIVPLLSFLVSHLLPLEALKSVKHCQDKDKDGIAGRGASVEDVQQATASLASSIPGRTIWDLFLKRLWQFDCSDTLDEFFSSLSDILVKTREERLLEPEDESLVEEREGRVMLSRHSPLGAFVRRVRL
ncbi:hypothetical protein FQN49_007844, partial [Arthroderma sp. PD_2]